MSINKIRNFLAATGASLNSIDKTYIGDYQYGDFTGNRTVASQSLQRADELLRYKINGPETTFSHVEQPDYINSTEYKSNLFQFNNQPSINMTQNQQMSREERLNKLLGKSSLQNISSPSLPSEHVQLVAALQEVLKPIIEHLEDIAIINGLTVQRLETLIREVNPNINLNNTSSFQDQQFEEFSEEPIETYDPEVSMSVIDDEEETVTPSNTKKRNKKTK